MSLDCLSVVIFIWSIVVHVHQACYSHRSVWENIVKNWRTSSRTPSKFNRSRWSCGDSSSGALGELSPATDNSDPLTLFFLKKQNRISSYFKCAFWHPSEKELYLIGMIDKQRLKKKENYIFSISNLKVIKQMKLKPKKKCGFIPQMCLFL